MVQGKPYVHWKIKDAVDLTEIDPNYLWGTVIETDKGPVDEPVFITEANQAKKIFNYNLDPFFANGGRYCVVVRAYGGEVAYSSFDITLDSDFSYMYVDYDYYSEDDDYPKATIKLIAEPGVGDVCKFKSYNATGTSQYGEGSVKILSQKNGKTTVLVLDNTAESENAQFIGNKYYVTDSERVESGDSNYYKLFTEEGLFTDVTIDVLADDTGITHFKPNANGTLYNVAFSEGRWRLCDESGNIKYYYNDPIKVGTTSTTTIKEAVVLDGKTYEEGATYANIIKNTENPEPKQEVKAFTKGFNESDVTKVKVAKLATIEAGSPVLRIEAKYPGDFLVPISIQKDIREGYRVSIKESDDYTIMLSGATKLDYIQKRIDERAENITAYLTTQGKEVQKPFSASLVAARDVDGNELPPADESAIDAYTASAQTYGLPVGSIFAKVKDAADDEDTDDYSFKLTETVSYLADGSNGAWDSKTGRIPQAYRLEAHANALDFLANIKLAGIFCNYGEDDLQKVYADHVSTTEPQGMNSAEVCKWRTLIVGANATDREQEFGMDAGFRLADKAVAFDNENIIFLGQGLIDDGYEAPSNIKKVDGEYVSLLNEDSGASQYQLLPFQCTQYIAGLRSKLFYGDAIFGGEPKKQIVGVGNIAIAPLFAGENKLLWQPDNYSYLNEHGVLTFTEDYNILSLTDGVTTRQSPLEEDEEGVQSIIKFAKHAVHEVLQGYIGRNITGDLETAMESSVRNVLTAMQTQDQTLVAVQSEGYNAFDIDIVLVPKSNAKQILAKAYVYLKLTPVHALRQIEVELTIQ